MSNHPDIRIEVYQRPELGGAKIADIVDHEGLERSFMRTGGCDTASFSLTRSYQTFATFSHLCRVYIWRSGALTSEWGGYFSHYEEIYDKPEKIGIHCKGFMHELEWRYVEDWQISNTPIDLALLDVLTQYAPGDIVVDLANIAGGG